MNVLDMCDAYTYGPTTMGLPIQFTHSICMAYTILFEQIVFTLAVFVDCAQRIHTGN